MRRTLGDGINLLTEIDVPAHCKVGVRFWISESGSSVQKNLGCLCSQTCSMCDPNSDS